MSAVLVALLAVAEPSPVAIGQNLVLGAALVQRTGELPGFLLEDSFQTYSALIHLRGGLVESTPSTPLGTQLGLEVDVRAGFTGPESKELNDSAPVTLVARLGLAMRAFTFNVPFPGMIAAHVSAELGLGGARWWAKTARIGFLGGVRVALGREGAGAELEYTVAPFYAKSTPGDLSVRHLEHRISIAAGAGELGVGFWLTITRDEWRLPGTSSYSDLGGRAVGASLEWRP